MLGSGVGIGGFENIGLFSKAREDNQLSLREMDSSEQ